MPVVPRAERRETLQDTPTPRTPRIAEGAFGEGLQRAAERGVESIGRLQEAKDRERFEIDKAVVSEADNNLVRARSLVESEIGQLRGKDSAAAMDVLNDRWGKIKEEAMKDLTDTQKAAVMARADFHYNGLFDKTLKHVDRETESYKENTYRAGRDLWSQIAIEGDEAELETAMATLEAKTKDRYGNMGAEVVNAEMKDIIDFVKKGREELSIRAEKESKEMREIDRQEANKELVDMVIDDNLSYRDIEARRGRLDENEYRQWVNDYEKQMEKKKKEAEKPKKIVEDAEINADLSSRAMTFPADATALDVDAFRKEVADYVRKGKLKPETGRSIIGDVERTLTLDPARKASESDIISLMKNNYNNDLYGEAGSDEARAEYLRQVNSFRKWTRANLDKEPIEYWEKVNEPVVKSYIGGLINRKVPAPEQRRKELEAGGKMPVERRRVADGRVIVKYSDGTYGVE